MNKQRLNDILTGVLIGAAAVIVIMCMVVTLAPTKRSTKATRYDLDCLTEDIKQAPLTECKMEADK